MKLIPVPYIDQTSSGAFTGCESASAVMLLRFLGVPMELDEFIDKYLDKAPFETRDGVLYGPNPWECFAGDPHDPEAMGCYAPVIAKALQKVLGNAWEIRDETGASLEVLAQKYLDRDIPVILWATIDMKEMIPGPDWVLTTGEPFSWRSNEHCLLLVGYDEENYIFSDPWQNNGIVYHPKSLAQNRYASQYSQALAVVASAT